MHLIISKLNTLLWEEVPSQYQTVVKEFESYIRQKQYRRAYLSLNKFRLVKDWAPSKQLSQYIKEFQEII